MIAQGGLTPRQAQVLAIIRRRIAETGVSPSIREIAATAGFRSHSRVSLVVKQLVQRGALVRGPAAQWRNIALADGAGAYRVAVSREADARLLQRAATVGCTPEALISRIIGREFGERAS